MKYKRLQGAAFLAIGIFLLLALAYMLGRGVVPDLTVWALVGIVAFCGCFNIFAGLVLVRR